MVRLAIADPPYPPNLLAVGHGVQARASRWYADRPDGVRPYGSDYRPADDHPGAAEWDDPARHRELLEHLVAAFDGWAIATAWDAPHTVYAPLPVGCRVLIWHRPNAVPTCHRVQSRYETVILYPPEGRRLGRVLETVPDVLTCPTPKGFAGEKPAAWVRWVLNALGFDPEVDTVVDLFPGSGAVQAEINQGVLPWQ